jgi:hypothetical protein
LEIRPRAGIAPRQFAHLVLEAVQLLEQNLMHGKKRLGDRLQCRVMLRKLHNPAGEARFLGPAHLETEAPQNTPETHLGIVELSLHQLAGGQKRVSCAGADLQCTGLNERNQQERAAKLFYFSGFPLNHKPASERVLSFKAYASLGNRLHALVARIS